MGVYIKISVVEYISQFSQPIIPFIKNGFLDLTPWKNAEDKRTILGQESKEILNKLGLHMKEMGFENFGNGNLHLSFLNFTYHRPNTDTNLLELPRKNLTLLSMKTHLCILNLLGFEFKAKWVVIGKVQR